MKKYRVEKEKIVAEYKSGNLSYREMGKKYGINFKTINNWVLEFEGRKKKYSKSIKPIPPIARIEEMPTDIKLLQSELRRTKLRNKVLEEVIRLTKEETGIDLIKKTGTKRS
jgi:transposase-like protein